MSQYLEGPRKSVKSASTAGAHLRWYISDGTTSPITVTLAGASNKAHVVNEDAVLVSGDEFSGRLLSAEGTFKMVASEAITGGNQVFAAASGKVASTGSVVEGIACHSVSANNDVIEVLPMPAGLQNKPVAAPQALSGPGAIDVTSYRTNWTTTGADAGTLADGTYIGQEKKVQLIVDGGDGTLTPTNLSGGTTITFADAGDFAVLIWNGADWVAVELGNDADGATAPVLA